jgi:FHA domain-containing protein
VTDEHAGQLDEDIVHRYPYPLVATYDRAYFQAVDAAEAHEYLLDLFEVTLKYCATIMVTQYLQERIDDTTINRQLIDIERPSLGHWHGWLRDILSIYRRLNRPLLVPQMEPFYRRKHTHEVLTASQGLTEVMSALGFDIQTGITGSVTTQQFFELLVGYRNKLAHGARPSPPQRIAVARLLAPALRDLYGEMAFVGDYRLAYIRSVSLEFDAPNNHRYRHYVTSLTGAIPRNLPNPYILDQPYPDKQLYLLKPGADFLPLLSLHPYFIFAHCTNCNREQTFVLNMSDAKERDYIGYQCTHHFSPTADGAKGPATFAPPGRPHLGSVADGGLPADDESVDSLETLGGDERVFALRGIRITLGRAQENDIALDADLRLSRKHAVLEHSDSGWRILDLGSSNGTYVNGTRIADAQPLHSGDEVQVGDTRLRFRGHNDVPVDAMETRLEVPG